MAIHLENSVDAVVSIFGVLKAGGVFVVVNAQVKADHLAYVLRDSEAFALITHTRKIAPLEDALRDLPRLQVVITDGEPDAQVAALGKQAVSFEDAVRPEGPSCPAQAVRNIDIDLAALVYTSGSTGRPKGVMLTHRNIVSVTESVSTYLGNTDDDVILSVLPLAFTYGLSQVMTAFHVGATLVLERSFAYPQMILETIRRERVTGLPVVPTVATLLLQLDLRKHPLPHLRYITNAAAALSTGKILQLRQALPHVKVFSMYGQTECQRISYLHPDHIDTHPRSVGLAIPNEEVYIVDEQGRRVGPGVVGELVVRGANVMKGYWRQPEATARSLRPGELPDERVLYTGDLFTNDADGYLYFVDRKDDIIKTRGEKVAPREVEEAISRLDGVAEVAVYGRPDDVLGQAVTAAVTLVEGASLTAEQVRRHCLMHLADFMVPKFVEIRDALPTTSTGKVSRRTLQFVEAATGGA